MEIQVKKQVLKLDGYEALTPEIDNAFKRFFEDSWLDDFDISRLDESHLPLLEKNCLDYLKAHPDTETARKYFKNLRFIWRGLTESGKLQEAEWFLERTLRPIRLWEQRFGFQIHKGPLYYFWGGTALLQGKLDQGFLLMHAAYEEDVRVSQHQPTPAFMFVALDFSKVDEQYFGPLVKNYRDFLDQYLIAYRLAKGSSFGIDDLRKVFLLSNPSPDIVFAFTHVLARLEQLSRYSTPYLYSDFASQLKLNLLFDLVLVIESALRIKHPDNGKRTLLFPALAESLTPSLTSDIKAGDMGSYINQEVNKMGFDQSLHNLLNRIFPFKRPLANRELESDLIIAYLIRNRGAHCVTPSKALAFRFDQLLQSLFNILFLSIEVKYY